MDAGRLRHRVTLEREDLTPLAGGSAMRSHAVIAVAWAAITLLNAGEDALTARRIAAVRYRITVRRRAGLAAADRILWDGRVLRVTACDDGIADAGILVFTAAEERGR